MIDLVHFQLASAALFSIGIYGVLARRSSILVLMSIELMLNAVNVNLIGYSSFTDFGMDHRILGQIFVIFIITVAAAEFALAVAIILRLYRNLSTVNIDEISSLKG